MSIGGHTGPDTLLGVPNRARRAYATAGVLVSLLAFAGCTVSPPPAPQSTETSRSSPPPPQRKTQIIMGIDSIGAGFNPHLLSDLSAVNAAISALVLPSAFRPVADAGTPAPAQPASSDRAWVKPAPQERNFFERLFGG